VKVAGVTVAPFWTRAWWKTWFADIGGGQPLFPLVVLVGLNCVDELDRRAFDVLLPNIRDSFGLSLSGILTVVSVAAVAAILLSVPIGFQADRRNRVVIMTIGAIAWSMFSLATGLATTIIMLGVARAGSGIGKAVVDPTHNSLLADYYDIPSRPKVFSLHRAGNALGLFLGPLLGGLLGEWLGWRAPFIIFAFPTMVFVILALKLKEPIRGYWERKAMGATNDTMTTEDIPPSFAESWRIVWSVRTLRRIFYSLPFLAMAIVGLASLTSLYYEQVFHLGAADRGFVAALAEPAAFIGLLAGIPVATKLMARDPGLVLKFVAAVGVVAAVAFAIFALTPNLVVAVLMNVIVSGVIAIVAPGIFASLSLAIPPKIRSFGFSVASLWVLPGLVILPVIGSVADAWGIRAGLLLMTPILLAGTLIIASAAPFVKADIQRVWSAAAAQSEVLFERRQGRVKLLLVRGVDVHYDQVQVLFNVDLEIDEGEIVALLGTNGAGKSTLLRAISGLVEPSNGAIVFDGRDMTHTPPDEIAGRGVTQVPGGQGVFPSLTVAENLQLASWIHRKDTARVKAATDRVLEIFPVLSGRLDEPAGNLSGGQQQMLTLGMAFIEKPRLLMIDELSLGLAPSVVGQLLEIVRALRDDGTTIILVEQSVNVALTVAETAYFMEKGEIRFHGPTSELLERPDVLRSVFLEGAATHTAEPTAPGLLHGGSAVTPNGATAPITNGVVTTPRPAEPVNGDDPTTTIEPRLIVTGVSKRFGGISALFDVSFSVAPGEILGFIGPNGAGKTTLFDVISGFTPAEAGSIAVNVDGTLHDVTRSSPQARARLGLGRSFQDGRLFPALTVAETIAVALDTQVDVRDPIAAALHLPAVIDSEAKVSTRVEELIELMGLGAFRDKFTRELSTGSRRIVDLACVLAHQPNVLLLDEPSSGIAQREAEALGPVLMRIRDDLGASVLVIEHDLPLLTSIADRMIALDLGMVIADGPSDEVVHDPRVVASYLGDDQAAISRSGPGGSTG
jgi:ABC-type branched-subunit amino acid transport system ATPase component/predicted MFS family arabinose efflux permease